MLPIAVVSAETNVSSNVLELSVISGRLEVLSEVATDPVAGTIATATTESRVSADINMRRNMSGEKGDVNQGFGVSVDSESEAAAAGYGKTNRVLAVLSPSTLAHRDIAGGDRILLHSLERTVVAIANNPYSALQDSQSLHPADRSVISSLFSHLSVVPTPASLRGVRVVRFRQGDTVQATSPFDLTYLIQGSVHAVATDTQIAGTDVDHPLLLTPEAAVGLGVSAQWRALSQGVAVIINRLYYYCMLVTSGVLGRILINIFSK